MMWCVSICPLNAVKEHVWALCSVLQCLVILQRVTYRGSHWQNACTCHVFLLHSLSCCRSLASFGVTSVCAWTMLTALTTTSFTGIVYSCVCVCVCACVNMCIAVCGHICVFVCVELCTCVCWYVYVCVYRNLLGVSGRLESCHSTWFSVNLNSVHDGSPRSLWHSGQA